MKKLIVALLVLGACHSSSPSTSGRPGLSGNLTGAADPSGAITAFLAAAKQQDLQAMGAIWGTKDGPARDQMDRQYMERTEVVMACHLKHDKFDIISDAPSPGGIRAVALSLTLGNLTRATTAEVVQGPQSRWYVQNIDISKLQEICGRKG